MSTKPYVLDQRRQHILKIILVATSVFCTLGVIAVTFTYVYRLLTGRTPQGASPLIAVGFALVFYLLYFLSAKGFHYFSAVCLLIMVLVASSYTSLVWGIDIPQALLLFVLAIIMSGILLGIRYISYTYLTSITLMAAIAFVQKHALILPHVYWRSEVWNSGDLIAYSVTFGVIALLSLLYTREIEKALARANYSEAILIKERDLLEIKVAKRTQALKRLEMERLSHVYRLADFGRITASLIHDLVSPLTQVTLNLEQLDRQHTSRLVKQAILSARRMENFVQATRQQLHGQDNSLVFNPITEIRQVITFLTSKAQSARVALNLSAPRRFSTFGNPMRFNQLLINLLTNALDAYTGIKRRRRREINITLSESHHQVTVVIEDFGCGITPANLKRLFEPFFTTKDRLHGTGIGLSISKLIAEKNFHGHLTATSTYRQGSTFTFTFPQLKSPEPVP